MFNSRNYNENIAELNKRREGGEDIKQYRRGGLVTKNTYRRGGVVSSNGYRKNMSRLGFQEGGYAHMPGYSSDPDMIHYLKLLQNEINNYDFSKEADKYHGTFLGTFFGTGKTRNDMLVAKAKQTGKTKDQLIKENPTWVEPIEDWTKKLLISQVDERIDEIQKNPTNQSVVNEAIKKTFQGGTILKFPQKLQDTIINRIGGGYRQQFGVPIDTNIFKDTLGSRGNKLKKQIKEIQTTSTDYVSSEGAIKKDKSFLSKIPESILNIIAGKVHAGELNESDVDNNLLKYSSLLASGATVAELAAIARHATTGKGQSWLPNSQATKVGIPNASTSSWWQSQALGKNLPGVSNAKFLKAYPTLGAQAGLVALTGATSYLGTKAILEATGADKKLNKAGSWFYDVTHKDKNASLLSSQTTLGEQRDRRHKRAAVASEKRAQAQKQAEAEAKAQAEAAAKAKAEADAKAKAEEEANQPPPPSGPPPGGPHKDEPIITRPPSGPPPGGPHKDEPIITRPSRPPSGPPPRGPHGPPNIGWGGPPRRGPHG
jgi:hypothetical protein